MRAVLLSIKPKYCEKIIAGEKTVEIRKTMPKLIAPPFKCYVYASGGGKIIGEFVCDYIQRYTCEISQESETCTKIELTAKQKDGSDYPQYWPLCNDSTPPKEKIKALQNVKNLSTQDLREYLGYGNHTFYGWSISGFKMFLELKNLADFEGVKETRFGGMPYKLKSAHKLQNIYAKKKERNCNRLQRRRMKDD